MEIRCGPLGYVALSYDTPGTSAGDCKAKLEHRYCNKLLA